MRCFYQPVVTYQTRTYFEPVTTYRTSYYYEPVTSYSYSCYFDPCSCSYQQVACPTTSYVMRSQCCPVQSWVQRCCSVPVTSYQKSCYWEPCTTCCAPPPCCPQPCCPPAAPCSNGVTSPPPAAEAYQPARPPADPYRPMPPPTVEDSRIPRRPPVVREEPNGDAAKEYDRYYGPSGYRAPSSYRQPSAGPRTVQPARPVEPPPQVRLDRIVSLKTTQLEGQIVRRDNAPRPNVRLRFVSAQRLGPQYPITANSAGRFRITLTSGSWLVYVGTPDGRETYHCKIDVNGSGTRRVTLVSR
jgi:hypothetical protein